MTPNDGPSLEQYVETRFTLLNESITAMRVTMVEALKEADLRYQQRFDAQAKALEAAFQAAKEAVQAALAAADRAGGKSEAAADKRFEAVNEFRQTLNDQQRTLIPRSEVTVLFSGLADKHTALAKQVDTLLAERAGIKGGWGYAVGVVGFLLALGALIVMGIKFVTSN